jgi:hypothetical protein
MCVKMLVTQWAAADESGATSTRYVAGGVYSPPASVAAVFLAEGFAELVDDWKPARPGPSEVQETAPGEANVPGPVGDSGENGDRKPGGRRARLGRKNGGK